MNTVTLDQMANFTDADYEERLRLSQAVYPDLGADWPGRHLEWSAPEWCVRVRNSAGSLVSYVGIHFRDALVDGQSVKIGGVGNVKTRPDARRRGFASAGISRAVEFFHERSNIDFALLVCEPNLVGYYARLGWREFTGRSLVRQDGKIVEFTFNRVMTTGIQASSPVEGVIDLCGAPW